MLVRSLSYFPRAWKLTDMADYLIHEYYSLAKFVSIFPITPSADAINVTEGGRVKADMPVTKELMSNNESPAFRQTRGTGL